MRFFHRCLFAGARLFALSRGALVPAFCIAASATVMACASTVYTSPDDSSPASSQSANNNGANGDNTGNSADPLGGGQGSTAEGNTDGGASTTPAADGGAGDGSAAAAPCVPIALDLSVYENWNPPTHMTGACTATEATALENALNTATNATDLEASVSNGCAACVFTQNMASVSWQLFVWKDKSTSDGFVNTDSCMQLAGISNDCAADDSAGTRCVVDACSAASCTVDAATYQACAKKAIAETCAPIVQSINQDCNETTYSTAESHCGMDSTGAITTFSKFVAKVCG